MKHWRQVYKDKQVHRATIVRDVLEDRNIEAMMIDKKDSMYGFGYYLVQVPADEVILALKIIQDEIQFE